MQDSASQPVFVNTESLRGFIAALFRAAHLSEESSNLVAQALVEADCQGKASHGVMLVPMYLERLRAGSISTRSRADIVSDTGSTIILDAHNALGQISANQAVRLLADRARAHGLASVAVRNAFHFGAAGHWACLLADLGLIGIVMSNTRPLMPAPGGAERVVGNNPLSIAMPSATDIPIVLDMAASAGAMGKIRLADTAGRPIPADWATDSLGMATTDPARAIKGMLLPAAGPKGFGLAFMIDLFCGGLSSGAIGDDVQALYGNASTPYGCAHFFMAIDVARFLPLAEFSGRASDFAERVRSSAKAAGTERLYSPGEMAWSTAERHRGTCPLDPGTTHRLQALAAQWQVDATGVFTVFK
ncbi:MAG: Ldh family oxidoreductase [Paralcaligenes sp.]